MSVQIRAAAPEDAQVVHRLTQSLAEYERLADQVRSSTESIRRSLEQTAPGNEPLVHVLLAEDQGRPVGFVWNKSARDFYEKLGARPMTEWVTYRLDADGIDSLAGPSDPLRE